MTEAQNNELVERLDDVVRTLTLHKLKTTEAIARLEERVDDLVRTVTLNRLSGKQAEEAVSPALP